MPVTGSVYLSNNYRLAFNCDSVVPATVAEKKATAYAERTGKSFYVPGLGNFPRSAPNPVEPVKAAKATTKKK
jgi:hypothetical protein